MTRVGSWACLTEVNSAYGGLNTVAFWMYRDRDDTSMPFSWGTGGANGYDDLWLVTGYPSGGMNGFGFNSGNGDISTCTHRPYLAGEGGIPAAVVDVASRAASTRRPAARSSRLSRIAVGI